MNDENTKPIFYDRGYLYHYDELHNGDDDIEDLSKAIKLYKNINLLENNDNTIHTISSNFNMTKVLFNEDDDKHGVLQKLSELRIIKFQPNKKNQLKKLAENPTYKEHGKTYPCKLLGYNYKDSPENSINEYCYNLIIEVNDKTFNINGDYLMSMQ